MVKDTKFYTVNLSDDPMWEVGDVRLLSITKYGSEPAEPRKYRVAGRSLVDIGVRYELTTTESMQ